MQPPFARREVLKALAAAVGGLVVVSCNVDAQPSDSLTQQENTPNSLPLVSALCVSVHEPGGNHLKKEAKVTVQRVDNGEVLDITRTPPRLTYGTSIEPGKYKLRVDADGFAIAEGMIDMAPLGLSVAVYLGQADWPSFRMGQSVVPFEANENLLGIAFSGKVPTESTWRLLLRSIGQLGFDPYPNDKSFLVAGKTVAIFKSKTSAQRIFGKEIPPSRSADFFRRLSSLLNAKGTTIRIGLPIDVRPGRVKLLDNRYVVRFRSTQSPAGARDLAGRHRADAYSVDGLDNTWRFEFRDRSGYLDHLLAAELLAKDKDVIYVEPNLILQLAKHGCTDDLATHSCASTQSFDLTDDPWSICQTNLPLQGVPDAWCFLGQKLGSGLMYGSSDVRIATVDSGINPAHYDITAGLYTQVKLCGDNCESDPHGMAVFGIVSAKPGNASGIAGIAPGVHHLAISLISQWIDPEWYAQMILWLSGVGSSAVFSKFPLEKPADIISCSHGIDNLPTPSPIAEAFGRASLEGRKHSANAIPLGAVLVYSAGNNSTDICGTQALATGPNVIAVGNTSPRDAQGVERLCPDSNFGMRIDLCAQGENAPSLLPNPTGTSIGSCLPNTPVEGAFRFGGTSAACPMVAATAALMLTLNKDLSWQDVRDRLRQTARCVDVADGLWEDHRSYYYGSGRLDVHEAVKAAEYAS